MRASTSCATALAASVLLACSETATTAGASGGTLLIATGSDPEAVLPPLVHNSVGKQVIDALYLPIARTGDTITLIGDSGYAPGIAERWTWSTDSLSIAFHIDPRARWHDGQPVRAADVRSTLAIYRAPAIAADAVPALVGVDSVSTPDSLTFVAWFAHRSPTQFYDLVTNLIPIPAHVYANILPDSLAAAPAARAPIGSGKFRFGRWLPGQRVEVIADTAHWMGRPGLDRVAWLVVTDPTAQAAMLAAGEADMVEVLNDAAIASLAGDTAVHLVSKPSLAYTMAVFNLHDPRSPARPHPLFGNRDLRRALSMAIDRRQLVASVLDSLGAAMGSPWVSRIGLNDARLLPFDSAHASALLDTLGWRDTDGDGIRQQGTRALEFTITAPASSRGRRRSLEVMEPLFKAVGVRMKPDLVEPSVQGTAAEAGRFDVTLLGFNGDPNPNSVRQFWKTEQRKAGSNYGGYSNPLFDATIDSAVATFDPTAAHALFIRAGQILAEDAPAIWIYEAKTVLGIRARFRTAAMPAHAWWANLDRWEVDPARRIDRDRIGPRLPPS
ncbi:MAG: hypothetical protein IT361_18975 [Gemmatimonadaceae bacterium]|nr:hypothetical protein [Gemmatimonadaceae bacterium]